jgi:hypothetical protein
LAPTKTATHVAKPAPRAEHPLANATRIVRPKYWYLVPPDCGKSGSFDLVLQFHAAQGPTEAMFRASELDAVVVIVNLGLASGPYENMFLGKRAFGDFLLAVSAEVHSACRGAGPRRVALSSWSAGYGATLRILEHEANRQRVDAVLLADGLHAALESKHPRVVKAVALAPVDRFADQAARGERLLAITHSEIATPSYASTTETANFLLASHGIEPEWSDLPGPRPSMPLRSLAQQGGLWVAGYGGQDASAHCDHLRALGETLLPLLAARWNAQGLPSA